VVPVDRISAEDRLMLWPDQMWPQDVGALAVIDGAGFLEADGRFRLEAARAAVESRLHLVPRFRQVLHTPKRGGGWPLWLDDQAFDVAHHVDVAQVPAPGDEAQLLGTVERLRRRRLDWKRPPWEMWFLPGLPDGRVGLFIRLHHVMADGIAGVASLAAFLDASPTASPATGRPWTPAPCPPHRDLIRDNLQHRAEDLRQTLSGIKHPTGAARRAREAWPSLRELIAEEPGPHTSLDRVVGPDRALALLRSNLDQVRHIAHANGATINDVLLAVTAGGLRGLLQYRGEPVEDVHLPIYVPVSLRSAHPEEAGGNLITQMVVRLPVGVENPVLRLQEIASRTSRAKSLARPSLGTTFRSRVLSASLLKLIVRQRVNLGSADLPGPEQPLYFAGSQLLEVFPLLNLIGNVSLSVGAMSYAGQFNAMIVADGDGYPDLDQFTTAAQSELQALAAAASIESIATH
jgi:diacylglycerol O-acyltransferase / wax synthase